MGLGAPALNTSQKKELGSGPPFASDSADNGLSVDAGTGKIVLGNDFPIPAGPAILLNSREIPLAGNSVFFSQGGGMRVSISADPGFPFFGFAISAGQLIDSPYYNISGQNFEPTSDTFVQWVNDLGHAMAMAVTGSASVSPVGADTFLYQFTGAGAMRFAATIGFGVSLATGGINSANDRLRVLGASGNVQIDPNGTFTGGDLGTALQVFGEAIITLLNLPLAGHLNNDVGQDNVTGLLVNRGTSGIFNFVGDGATKSFAVTYGGTVVTPQGAMIQALNALTAAGGVTFVDTFVPNGFTVHFTTAPAVGAGSIYWQTKNAS